MVIVKGFDGDSAIFPCYIEGQDKIRDVNVHWKDSNDNTMYEIIAGNGTVEKQALKYKNRVQSERGNCSVTLNKLNKTWSAVTRTVSSPFCLPIGYCSSVLHYRH